jgi:hypothetical protein
MKMTDNDGRIQTIAEVWALEGFLEGEEAQVLSTWVISCLVHGVTQVDLDIAINLFESKRANAALQVWMDEARRGPVHTWDRSDLQRDN